ncbi:hypothetical protein BDW69DRAFT_45136 [Aspergillus filifer]
MPLAKAQVLYGTITTQPKQPTRIALHCDPTSQRAQWVIVPDIIIGLFKLGFSALFDFFVLTGESHRMTTRSGTVDQERKERRRTKTGVEGKVVLI